MLSMTDQEFTTLTNFIHQKFGINLSQKRVLIEGRMSALLQKRGITTFDEYMKILFADTTGAEMTTLLNKLTTNHTYFMRETEHFKFLESDVLPYFERMHERDKSLRIWSAGCSSGQEPYNISMLLNEYFGPRRSAWRIQLLATDISMNVLTQAHAGVYPAEITNQVPPAWAAKYFTKLPSGEYQVVDFIRSTVDFRTLNLMDPFRFSKPFDLIFCRNVMIYFDGPTKERLVSKFYDWTAPGGYLFIGHSENINKDKSAYRFVKPAIYKKEGAR